MLTIDQDLSPEELAEARRYSLQIVWSPEDEVYVVSLPQMPGLHTHGATAAEAAEMGEELIANRLAMLRDEGRIVPPPPRTARRSVVEPPPVYDGVRIRTLRQRLRVSQPLFAAALNVSAATVKSWEQGRRTPDGASLRLLELAEKHPQIVVGTTGPHFERSDTRADRGGTLSRASTAGQKTARAGGHPAGDTIPV